jgi:precorrin-6B methylase 2
VKYIDYGETEFQVLDFYVLNYLNSGNTFVDVGAHTGQETIPAAQLIGPTGIVFSFEPNPHAAKILKEKCQ